MAKGDAPVAEKAAVDTSGDDVRAMVRWVCKNHFEWRRIEAADWVKLGASADKAVAIQWDSTNHHLVPRSDIPLTDEQLAAYLDQDTAFKLVKV